MIATTSNNYLYILHRRKVAKAAPISGKKKKEKKKEILVVKHNALQTRLSPDQRKKNTHTHKTMIRMQKKKKILNKNILW